jgi:hypothetical protein
LNRTFTVRAACSSRKHRSGDSVLVRTRGRGALFRGAGHDDLWPGRRRGWQMPREACMTFIPMVPEDQATGELARSYKRAAGPDGRVDNILRVHSLNPPSLGHHLDLYAHLMRGPSPLTRVQREMIGVVVSASNDCFY